ncbi:hypothetical protein G3567_09995 [Psychroflexus sp. YR1-1]|uniref:DUF4868 domain-containing protein n=2 Tax=Psychroflexus aurantiacus TaxID=2709310 RepID=A0A6B3R2H5_9FLAO|nr:hypothetical protein [Psychroflexus aurantiacus]
MLTSYEEDEAMFLAVQISKNRLISFLNGSLDLRDVFENPEIKQWFTFSSIEDDVIAVALDVDALPKDYLPDAGFVFKNHDKTDDIIVNESIEYSNAIVHLAISDEQDNYSIEADDLGDIMKLYQVILENTYKKELLNKKVKDKKAFYAPQNYKLRAFASSYSSFNVHLYSTSQTDMFGNAVIQLGLEKLNAIISDFDNEDNYLEILRTVKGHSVSTLKKLVKRIIDDNLIVKHKWYSPNQEKVHFTSIDSVRAQKIYEVLNASEELAEEVKEFIGHLVQIDVDKGTWRVFNIEDETEYPGESNPALLQGLTVETVNYKLICTEIIEAMKVSEKEKVKYILNSIEEIG